MPSDTPALAHPWPADPGVPPGGGQSSPGCPSPPEPITGGPSAP